MAENDKERQAAENATVIKGTIYGEPVQTRLTGGRWLLIAGSMVFVAIYLKGIKNNLETIAELQNEHINLEYSRLKLDERRHELDSVRHADFMRIAKSLSDKQK